MIRVLIADSSPLFRKGMCATIQEQSDMQVVGEAETADDLIHLATDLSPDVIICGINSADVGGPELTRSLHLRLPNSGVILFTDAEDEEQIFEAVKAGACAYLLKTTGAEELASTIRRVGSGEHVIDETLLVRPSIASKVLQQFNTIGDDTPQEIQPLLAPLSPREIEILEQICQGNSNKQIGRALFISEHTVKNHITSILKKLAVNDRTEAMVYSLRRGWIRVDPIDR